MKRIRYAAWLAGLISLLVLSQAGAEEKLESGKDRNGPSGLDALAFGKRNTFLVTIPQDAT